MISSTNSKIVVGGDSSETNFVKSQHKGSAMKSRKKYNSEKGSAASSETCKFCKLNVIRSKCTKEQCKTSCFLCKKLGTRKSFVLRILIEPLLRIA